MDETLPLVALEAATLGAGDSPLLDQVSLTVRAGERVHLSGESGQGKSLLLEVLAGRHRLTTGKRLYPAYEAEFPDARLGIAPRFKLRLVSSDEQRRVALAQLDFYQARWQSLWSSPMTLAEYLSPANVLGLRPFELLEDLPVRRDFDRERSQAISDLELEDLGDRTIAQLSNGELRKLLLAAAHLASPDLLLLDDPFGGLSASSREHLVSVIARWCDEGQTLVFSGRNNDELSQLATRLIFVERGRVTHLDRQGRSLTDAAQHEVDTETAAPRSSMATACDVPPCVPRDATPHGSRSEGAGMGAPLIECSDISVRMSGKVLLDGITWTVTEGQNHLVTGPNGSGKTTLLAVILGDHPQSYASDVRLLGLRHGQGSTLRDRRRKVGYVAPELVWHYPRGVTLRELVASGFDGTLGLHRELSRGELHRVSSLLVDFGLTERADQALASLSEGAVRLGLLMRALVHEPRLLLLDEPTQELGRVDRAHFFAHLVRLAMAGQTTFVLVTHHVEECPVSVTHHLHLERGAAKYLGPIDASPFVQGATRGGR